MFDGLKSSVRAAWEDYWPSDSPTPRQRWSGVNMDTTPTFDPMLGFPNGRKGRETVATREEIIDAGLPAERRDYCAHKYIQLFSCIRDTGLFQNIILRKCDHIKHDYEFCEYEDMVLRYKEYERERRLRERQKRRIAKGLELDPNAPTEETM